MTPKKMTVGRKRKGYNNEEEEQRHEEEQYKDPEDPHQEEVAEDEEIAAEMENEEDGDMLSIPELSKSIDLPVNLRPVIDDGCGNYPANYTVRSSWAKLEWLKKYLSKNKKVDRLFRKSCFAHFLDLTDKWVFPGMLCHYLLLHSVKSKKKREMWFIVDNKPLRFGLKEYALITGLNCGLFPPQQKDDEARENGQDFMDKLLAGRNSIKGADLESMLDNDKAFGVRDKLKISLLIFIHFFLLAKDPSKIVEPLWIYIVDNADYFNSYPWGRISYNLTLECLRSRDMKKAYNEWANDKKHLSRFNLQGFPWAFMLWAYEAIPIFGRHGDGLIPSDSLRKIPRMLAYQMKRAGKWDYATVQSLLQSNEVVVHPFLIPTRRETRAPWIVSLVEREDVSDDIIDGLKKTLEGVTKLTNPIVPSEERSLAITPYRSPGIKRPPPPSPPPPPPPPPSSSPSPPPPPPPSSSTPPPPPPPPPPPSSSTPPPPPPPPPSSATDPQLLEFMQMMNQKFDLMNQNFDLMRKEVDLGMRELRKRVDFAVGVVTKLSKTVDLAMGDSHRTEEQEDMEKNDEFVRERRTRKKSQFMISPYTAEIPIKKSRIAEEKTVEIYHPVGTLWSVSEEKKESFFRWYDRVDCSKRAKGFYGDYDREFFSRFLGSGCWLEDSHLQEGLSLLRKKQSLYPDAYDQQHSLVLDAYFQQYLDGEVDRLGKVMKINPKKKLKKSIPPAHSLSIVEVEKLLFQHKYNTTFDDYFCGRRLKDGRHWREDVRKVYGILHINNMHWITIVWFLDEGRIELLDCSRHCYSKEILQTTMWAPCVLFPKLLKVSGQFTHLNPELLERPWKYTFVDNFAVNRNSGDCGVYALEFLEFHMTKNELELLQDDKIPFFREAIAVEIFQGEC